MGLLLNLNGRQMGDKAPINFLTLAFLPVKTRIVRVASVFSVMTIIEELNIKVEEVTQEILQLQKLPISASWWDQVFLINSRIPIPSSEVICVFFFCLLNEPELEKIITGPSDEKVKEEISKIFNNMPVVDVRRVAFEFCRLERILGYEYRAHEKGAKISIWAMLIENFREPKTACHRLVAQNGVSFLTNVALLKSDVEMIEALPEAFKEVLYKTSPRNKNVNNVISSVLYYYPYLKNNLGRDPTKEELKNFILHVEADLSDEPRDWATAHKFLGIHNNKFKDRTVIPDHETVLRIARGYRDDPVKLC